MLEGCTPWPEEFARRYREKGYWAGMTLSQMLEHSIARYGSKEALTFQGQRISYAELGARVDRLAMHFVASGLQPLERAVMQVHNCPEFLYTFLALAKIGIIPVMALRQHRATEIRHFLTSSQAVAYFIPDMLGGFDYRAMAEEMQREVKSLRSVFVVGAANRGQLSLPRLLEQPISGIDLASRHPDPGEVALMLLSGGTTSVPKLIPRTHNDYHYNARQAGHYSGYGPDTIHLTILPFAHNYTLVIILLPILASGGRIVIGSSAEAEAVFPLIEKERVTVIGAVPPLAINWMASAVPDRHDLSSLRVVQCGGMRLAPDVRMRIRERLRCTYQEIYGTAEGMVNMVRLDDPLELQLNSSGAPISPEDEIKVLDDADHEVADGTPGELVTRGPYTIRGYYNNPAANRASFTPDGFYRTGDVVKKYGRYVSAEGRKKDLINRGGEKISCEEIEDFIIKNPKVRHVCVVGMKDPVLGERGCAYVILKQRETMTLEELKGFLLAQKIAKFKLPERLEVVNEFPMSPVGKILRRRLRDMIDEKVARERSEAAAGS